MRRASKRGDAPTDRQRQILETIARLHRELGQPPSAAAVGRALGISRAGARRQIQALEAKGWLVDEPVRVSGHWRLSLAARRMLE